MAANTQYQTQWKTTLATPFHPTTPSIKLLFSEHTDINAAATLLQATHSSLPPSATRLRIPHDNCEYSYLVGRRRNVDDWLAKVTPNTEVTIAEVKEFKKYIMATFQFSLFLSRDLFSGVDVKDITSKLLINDLENLQEGLKVLREDYKTAAVEKTLSTRKVFNDFGYMRERLILIEDTLSTLEKKGKKLDIPSTAGEVLKVKEILKVVKKLKKEVDQEVTKLLLKKMIS